MNNAYDKNRTQKGQQDYAALEAEEEVVKGGEAAYDATYELNDKDEALKNTSERAADYANADLGEANE